MDLINVVKNRDFNLSVTIKYCITNFFTNNHVISGINTLSKPFFC